MQFIELAPYSLIVSIKKTLSIIISSGFFANELKRKLDKGKKVKIGGFSLGKEDFVFRQVGLQGQQFDGGVVVLDTRVDDELKREWLFRDLVRAVQEKRKRMGLKVTERIKLYVGDDFPESKVDELARETGSEVIRGTIKGKKGSFVFENKKIEFGIER